ncbi:hypothetical protein DFP72DRAFT_202739 [Ephemerocybe angulata]|uniref:Secreted protein n=1 Tax=Ephemerocybe angulata TaxID=980116 RepID=A0A8H6IJK7_9AGAR|nr:hypothetical protein DFP72DRAFT_202739 [Tulosesus angulatus]
MAWLTSLLAFTVPTCDSFARALLESTRNLRCGIRSGGREVLAGAVDGGGMQREPSRGSACDLRKVLPSSMLLHRDSRWTWTCWRRRVDLREPPWIRARVLACI